MQKMSYIMLQIKRGINCIKTFMLKEVKLLMKFIFGMIKQVIKSLTTNHTRT